MKHFIPHAFVALAGDTLLTACANSNNALDPSLAAAVTSKAVKEMNATPTCAFPDSPQMPAPTWVCAGSKESGPVFQAVGTAKLNRNLSLSQRRAAANARIQLAQRTQTEVSSLLRDYSQEVVATEAGETFNSGTIDVVTEEFVEQKLSGTTVRDRATNPDKQLYVLMIMDVASTKKIMQDTISLVGANDKALQKKLNLDEAMKRLDARKAQNK